MELHEIVYSRRKELGLTLEEVALAVGTTRSTVRKWEKGIIKDIRRDKVIKLADALQTSISFIMGLTDDPEETDKALIVKTELLTLGFDKEKIDKLTADDISLIYAYIEKLLDSKN